MSPSFRNAKTITPSPEPLATAAAALLCNVTTAGDIVITTLNDQDVIIALPVGLHLLPIATKAVAAEGTTATATFTALW